MSHHPGLEAYDQTAHNGLYTLSDPNGQKRIHELTGQNDLQQYHPGPDGKHQAAHLPFGLSATLFGLLPGLVGFLVGGGLGGGIDGGIAATR